MSGSSVLALLALVFLGTPAPAAPGKKAAAQNQPEAYAIVAGTVFRDPGFALPGAKVVLTLRDSGKKIAESLSSPRGEFAFRVQPKQATYILKASLKGYRTEEKEAAIEGQERIDVSLVLSPESKSK